MSSREITAKLRGCYLHTGKAWVWGLSVFFPSYLTHHSFSHELATKVAKNCQTRTMSTRNVITSHIISRKTFISCFYFRIFNKWCVTAMYQFLSSEANWVRTSAMYDWLRLNTYSAGFKIDSNTLLWQWQVTKELSSSS